MMRGDDVEGNENNNDDGNPRIDEGNSTNHGTPSSEIEEVTSTPTTLPIIASTSTTISTSSSSESKKTLPATTPSTTRSQYTTPMLRPHPPSITIPDSSESLSSAPILTPTPMSTVAPVTLYPASDSTKTPAPATQQSTRMKLKEPPKLSHSKAPLSRIPAYLEYQHTPSAPETTRTQTDRSTHNTIHKLPTQQEENEDQEKEDEDIKVDYWDDGSECSIPSFARQSKQQPKDDQSDTSSIASKSSFIGITSRQQHAQPQHLNNIQWNNKLNESDVHSVATTSHTHTSNFSVVSGAQGSVLNYKQNQNTRRRVRPWDEEPVEKKDTSEMLINERTYLLSDAEYGKLKQSQYPKNRHHPKKTKKFTMNMRWSGGFFTQSRSDVENDDQDEIRLAGSSNSNMDDLISVQSMRATSSLSFSHALMVCMGVHFFLLTIHDLFLSYISWRRREDEDGGVTNPPFWLSSNGLILNPLLGPGCTTLYTFGGFEVNLLVYDWTMFWRMLTSMSMCTSITQLLVSCWMLRYTHVVCDMQKWGFVKSMVLFVCGCLGGAFFSILGVVGEGGGGGGSNGEGVVGLNAGGMMSLIVMGWLERFNLLCRDMHREKLYKKQEGGYIGAGVGHNDLGGGVNLVSIKYSSWWMCGCMNGFGWRKQKRMMVPLMITFVCVLVEYMLCWFPYSSVGALNGGLIMGLAMRLMDVSPFLRGYQSDDVGEDDVEDVTQQAPLPPLPPYSAGESSAGYDSIDRGILSDGGVGVYGGGGPNTPIMRRSIIASPDDDDDPDDGMGYGSSNNSAAVGSRQRRGGGRGGGGGNNAFFANGTDHMNMYTPNMNANATASKDGMTMKRRLKTKKIQNCCRIFGWMLSMSMVIVPVSLVCTGVIEAPSYGMVQESRSGYVTMHRLYVQDASSSSSSGETMTATAAAPTCAQAYLPLSLQHRARRSGKMKRGQCADLGFRCLKEVDVLSFGSPPSSASLLLWHMFSLPLRVFGLGSDYETEMNVYSLASSGESCPQYGSNGNNGSNENEEVEESEDEEKEEEQEEQAESKEEDNVEEEKDMNDSKDEADTDEEEKREESGDKDENEDENSHGSNSADEEERQE